jgi:hypothetical protein
LIVALFNEDGKEIQERFMGEVLCMLHVATSRATVARDGRQDLRACEYYYRDSAALLTLAQPQLILNISKLVPLKWAVKDSFVLQVRPREVKLKLKA